MATCVCGKQSKCKTRRCACVVNGLDCSSQCKCCKSICENYDKRVLLLSNNKNSTHKIDVNSNDTASSEQITFADFTRSAKSYLKLLKEDNLIRKSDSIQKYRDYTDLYTYEDTREIASPQIDHIVEDQIVAHSMATVFKNRNDLHHIFEIRKAINDLYNYNVTYSKINQSKGRVIKSFLSDGMYKNEPLRAIVLAKTYECSPYFDYISNTLVDTYPVVVEHISNCRLNNGHVAGNNEFGDVAEELNNLFDRMKLTEEVGIKLRNNKIVK